MPSLLSMGKQNQLGQSGEAIAIRHLEESGYNILETNWRWKRAEIDIIAKIGEVLVFVEVKTREQNLAGLPEAFLTTDQEARIEAAAGVYMEAVGHEWEIRFDLIGITFSETGEVSLRHYKDAFFPGME